MGEAGPESLLNGSWWWANGNGIQIPSNAPALLDPDGGITTREQLRDQIQPNLDPLSRPRAPLQGD